MLSLVKRTVMALHVLVLNDKFAQISLATRQKVADGVPMKISWTALTFLFLLAVGLVLNALSGQLGASTTLTQSTIAADPSSSPTMTGMVAGMNCCIGTPTCVAGSGPAGMCSSGIALPSSSNALPMATTIAKATLMRATSLVTVQTLQPLARPPRA